MMQTAKFVLALSHVSPRGGPAPFSQSALSSISNRQISMSENKLGKLVEKFAGGVTKRMLWPVCMGLRTSLGR